MLRVSMLCDNVDINVSLFIYLLEKVCSHLTFKNGASTINISNSRHTLGLARAVNNGRCGS